MGFKRRFFGDKYLNREGVLRYLYYRIIIRCWFIDLPILNAMCYFIPWEKLYSNIYLQSLIQFMESKIPNIQKNRYFSDFPEYAVTYLSVIHLLGFICLIFPIIYSRPIPEVGSYLEKHGHSPIKMFIFGVIGIFIFIVPFLYTGAVTYLGCYQCSYHNKLSLIAGAMIPWAIVNLFFLYVLMLIKFYLK